MSSPGDDFPQIQLKLLLNDFPTILIISFYVFFILLITLLFYLYILIFDYILQLYQKRNYYLQNNDQIPLR
jgi:type III secretory pathway component EscU